MFMVIERPDFTPTRTEEERAQDKGRVISVRFNEEELAVLEHFKNVLDTDNEGKVLKILLKVGSKVIQDQLGDDILKWMSRRGRARVLGVQE